MQTFLPYEDFDKSLRILDYRRLGKQRVETFQLLKSLGNTQDVLLDDVDVTGVNKGWVNHPARNMWRGYEGALAVYHDASIKAWLERGYKNTMRLRAKPGLWPLPPWWGNAAFHAAHRSNLLRKAPDFYGELGWAEGPELDYLWPSKGDLGVLPATSGAYVSGPPAAAI
jgi:hypothetical protein